MASLGAIAGGIALSPFRATGAIAKGSAKLAGAGLKGLAAVAMDVSGATPLFAAAVGIKKGITAGYKKGKELLRPIGEGAVDEQSAHEAIAAAASETAKIQAETAKIEAEADALRGETAGPKTTMGGIDVEILEKIYDEVHSIRNIVGDADPESEKKELALDEEVRHKKFLKALEALGFRGADKKDKGPTFFGDLLESFKKFLPMLIAGLGLGGLIALWPKLSSAFEGIAEVVANINEFIDDMAEFFGPIHDWFKKLDPTVAAALGGTLKGIKSQSKTMAQRRQAMRQARANSIRLKNQKTAQSQKTGQRANLRTTLTRWATGGRVPVLDQGRRGAADTQRVTRGGPGRWAAVSRLFRGGAQGALPEGVKVPRFTGTGSGRGQFVEKTGARLGAMLDDVDTKKPTAPRNQPFRGGSPWKSIIQRAPFINPVTQKPMSSRYYYRPDTGRWHDVTKTKGSMVKGVVVQQYLQDLGMEFKPGERNFKLTAQQLKFLGEEAGFINRMQGSMRWMGKAAGPLAIAFIGYAIKNAYDIWKADPETVQSGDKWPFNDSTGADNRFKIDMAALAASFGVGWVAAILGGAIGTTIGGPIGGFLGGLALGVGAGLAADKVTRWLLGEEVDTREKKRKRIKSASQHSRDFLTGHVANKQADFDKAIAKETTEGGWFGIGAYTQEEKIEDIRKAAIALAAAKTHAASETKRIDETERIALEKLDAQDQESLQKMLQGTQPSAAVLPGSNLMPTQVGGIASGRDFTGTAEGSRISDAIQPNTNTTGQTLNGVGTVFNKADMVVNNINNTTNSESQQISSTASTSNVITFDKRPGRAAAIRARYG